jgi:hypothetical protein
VRLLTAFVTEWACIVALATLGLAAASALILAGIRVYDWWRREA